MTAPQHELTLNLPAAHRGVRIARSVVQRFSRMQGLPQTEADALVLVVSELLGNAIDHGGGEAAMTEEDLDGDIRMRLNFVMSADSYTLSVTDQGGGNAEEIGKLLDTADFFDLEDDRGRGLFLLKQSVDAFDVLPSPDGTGLTFRVSKRYGADQ